MEYKCRGRIILLHYGRLFQLSNHRRCIPSNIAEALMVLKPDYKS
jgi:hypothetical protein